MLIHNKLEKIGAVFILLSFFLHIFVFVYTQRKKAEGASFCHLKVCHPGCHVTRAHREWGRKRSLFSATTPAARPPRPSHKASAHSKSSFQQQACSVQSLLCLVYASLLWVLRSSHGSQVRKATMLVSFSVFALVTCQHTHLHSGKQLCSLVCIQGSDKDEVSALSISRRDTWYLVEPLFFSRHGCYQQDCVISCGVTKGNLTAWHACLVPREAQSGGSFKVTVEKSEAILSSSVWGGTLDWVLQALLPDCLIWSMVFNKMPATTPDSLDKDCFVL